MKPEDIAVTTLRLLRYRVCCPTTTLDGSLLLPWSKKSMVHHSMLPACVKILAALLFHGISILGKW